MASKNQNQQDYCYLRPMRTTDLPVVTQLENDTFEQGWTLEHFKERLSSPRHTCIVATINDKVVGYLVYEKCGTMGLIETVAVKKTRRREHIGLFLVDRAAALAKDGGMTSLRCHLLESDLASQLFFKALEFKCVRIIPNSDGRSRDLYYFIRRLVPVVPKQPTLELHGSQIDRC